MPARFSNEFPSDWSSRCPWTHTVWGHSASHQSRPPVGCIHLQEQAVGRLSDRGHSSRVIHLEVITFSTGSWEADPRVLFHRYTADPHLRCNPAAQPPGSTLRGSLCSNMVHGANKIQGQKQSASCAGAPRAVFPCLLSWAPAARRWCAFEPELWLCVGTERMLPCRWKKEDVYHFVFVSSERHCLLLMWVKKCHQENSPSHYQDFLCSFCFYSSAFSFVASSNLEALAGISYKYYWILFIKISLIDYKACRITIPMCSSEER